MCIVTKLMARDFSIMNNKYNCQLKMKLSPNVLERTSYNAVLEAYVHVDFDRYEAKVFI